MMSLKPGLCLVAVVFVTLAGCGEPQEWVVSAQNDSNAPVELFVTLGADGASKANVILEGNNPRTLISGKGATIVNTITVIRGNETKVQKVDEKLPGGKCYHIRIERDGAVNTSSIVP